MFLDGKKIGLFGGSFDPPHLGHVHFSLQAIKLFNLDKVIWLISPGNPLKSIAPAPIIIRIEQAQKDGQVARRRAQAARGVAAVEHQARPVRAVRELLRVRLWQGHLSGARRRGREDIRARRRKNYS